MPQLNKSSMLAWFGIAALAALSVVLWLTRYRYDHIGTAQIPVRINRFTGTTEILSYQGWRVAKPADPFAAYGGHVISSGDPLLEGLKSTPALSGSSPAQQAPPASTATGTLPGHGDHARRATHSDCPSRCEKQYQG